MGPKSGVLLILLSLLALSQGAAKGADEKFRLSALRHWWRDWAVPPWIPLVGDADGDGRADLVAVEPGGRAISVERTSPLGKWVRDPEPNKRFGNDPVAAAVGRFTGDAADELLALGRDGSLRLAFGMKRGTRTYTREERVGEVPAADVPASVAPPSSADINHDGRIDVLVPRGDGRLLVLWNRKGDGGRPRFDGSLALGAPTDAMEIDVGTFGARRASGWYGSTQTVDSMPPRSPLPAPAFKWEAPSACSKSARARIWRWEGSSAAQAMTSSPVANSSRAAIPPRPSRFDALPTAAEWKSDLWWRAGDIDGNGMDDLVRKRTLPASAGGPEVVIQFAARPGEAQPGYFDDDLDGLPDAWETGAIRPGGLDLKALGCKPGRSDVIVELERFDTVDVPLLYQEVEVTVRYFASLPVANPDGTRGIAMHVIYRPPTPHAKFDEVNRHFQTNGTRLGSILASCTRCSAAQTATPTFPTRRIMGYQRQVRSGPARPRRDVTRVRARAGSPARSVSASQLADLHEPDEQRLHRRSGWEAEILRAIPKGGSPRSSSTSVTSRSEFPFVLTRCGSCPGRRTCFRSSPRPAGSHSLTGTETESSARRTRSPTSTIARAQAPEPCMNSGAATPPLLSSPTAALIPDDCWCFMVRPER